MFIAIEFEKDSAITAKDVCYKMMEFGILVKYTHDYTIRFSPPLIINEKEIDHLINITNKVINRLWIIKKYTCYYLFIYWNNIFTFIKFNNLFWQFF